MSDRLILSPEEARLEELHRQAQLRANQIRYQRTVERAKAANLHPNDYAVHAALEDAIHAVQYFPSEAEKIEQLISETEDAEEREYLEWQLWVLEKQLYRAHDEALKRKELLRSLDTPSKIRREKESFLDGAQGTIDFINRWGWTADPRPDSPLFNVPFVLFPFQEDGIRWIERLVFDLKTDGIVDKSRDMGVSWLTVAFATKHWLAAPRQKPFLALFGSRKEEVVDELGNYDTLFEKIRHMIRHVPSMLLPTGFDVEKNLGHLKIINPETRSALTGESSNPNFGRAGRYTVIFFDEHAAFPDGGFEAWTASSQSSRSKISIATPKGKLNKQALLAHDPRMQGNRKKSYHWRLHPWKTQAWYNGQKRTMTDVEVAQELDIDYNASQPGRVFQNYDETHHVITWKEFARIYPKSVVKDENGEFVRYRIPLDWKVGRFHDWGSTENHPAIVLWLARVPEGQPYAGSVFIYREHQAKTGAIPKHVAEYIKDVEKLDGEGHFSRMAISQMSHEAKSERDTYSLEHKLEFTAWNTDYNAGIAQIRNYLELTDRQTPNPFIIYPANTPEDTKLYGRPRMMLLVDDKEGELQYQEEMGRFFRPMPSSHRGLIRLRAEFPVYHYPEEEQGKPVQRMRPFKLFDDAMDCVRAAGASWFPAIRPESLQEKLSRLVPAEFKDENIRMLSPEQQIAAIHSREFEMERIRRSIPQPMNWRKRAQMKKRAA